MNTEWTIAEGFGAVADLLERQLADDAGYSAQVAAYAGNRLVIDAWGGPGLQRDDLICVFSVSKGVSAVCVAMLVERGLLDLDARVADYWPEFAAAGKERVLVRELLSHRAGLVEVDGGLTWAEYLDDAAGAARLAAQRPFWRPGLGWSYHALSLGVLINELFRRIAGETVQSFFEREVRRPHDIEFWLGLPEHLEPRVAPVIVPELLRPPLQPVQVSDVVAGRILWDPGFEHLANSRESHAAGIPAAGGVGSARGIARIYAAVGADLGGGRLLQDATIDKVGQIQSTGHDLLTGQAGRFGVVFQKPWADRPFASYRAIGHDGAAGALGFYDPVNGLGFGYTTNRPAPADGDRRADALGLAIAAAID